METTALLTVMDNICHDTLFKINCICVYTVPLHMPYFNKSMLNYLKPTVHDVLHNRKSVLGRGQSLPGVCGGMFVWGTGQGKNRVYATESWGEEETVCGLIQNKSKVKSEFQRENVLERITRHL